MRLLISFGLMLAFVGLCSKPSKKPVKKLPNLSPSAPRWIVYSNEWVPGTDRPPNPGQIAGFNVFVLSFFMTSGPADKALEFTLLDIKTRSQIIADFHANGISLMVAVFGADDAPTSTRKDPVKLAKSIAKFVKDYDLDGVDIDWEDFDSINAGTGRAEGWIINFTKALRKLLPVGEYLLTHAPIAPWFSSNTTAYPFGAYRAVNVAVGSLIDWYNVQYYNQDKLYNNCTTMLNLSAYPYPHTSIFEIHSRTGIPLNKLVIGKPASRRDTASGGYMSSEELGRCLKSAKDLGWNGGAMFWQFPRANRRFLEKVTRGNWDVGTDAKGESDDVEEGDADSGDSPSASSDDKKTLSRGGTSSTGMGGDDGDEGSSLLRRGKGHKLTLTGSLLGRRKLLSI